MMPFSLSPRLDNQAICHASLYALLTSDASASTNAITFADHEEVGSGSSAGAAGNMVEAIMRRVAETEVVALPRWVATPAAGPSNLSRHGPCGAPKLLGSA